MECRDPFTAFDHDDLEVVTQPVARAPDKKWGNVFLTTIVIS